MKNITYILAVITLVSCSSENKNEDKKDKNVENTTPSIPTVKSEGLKMAYYALDTLKVKYTYYTEVEARIKKKQERFQRELTRRQKSLEEYAYTNDQRAKTGQLSENEIAQIQQEFQSRQAALYEYQQKEGTRLEEETFKSFEVVNKRVQAAGKSYCKMHQIDVLFIYGEGGQINFINAEMDATNEFIAYLNQEQDEIEKDLGKSEKKK